MIIMIFRILKITPVDYVGRKKIISPRVHREVETTKPSRTLLLFCRQRQSFSDMPVFKNNTAYPRVRHRRLLASVHYYYFMFTG